MSTEVDTSGTAAGFLSSANSNGFKSNSQFEAPASGKVEDILIHSMQLVDTEHHTYMPNYLVDTKIYTRLKRNAIVEAQPHEIHFEGFELGAVSQQHLTLTNVATSVETFHIVPPQSKYFILKYTKPDRLVPGFGIKCTIEFHPDELRYYYDKLQIHSRDEENNILVPIHAYPVAKLNAIPEFLKFPFVPVGKQKTLSLPLKSTGPVDFDFVINILQDHPAFRVEPKKGVLRSNSKVDIQIEFSPFDFVTAHMTLQVVLSQYNFKPHICYVSGYAEPGMERRLVREAHGDMELFDDAAVLDPRLLSPLDRARDNRRTLAKLTPSPNRTSKKNRFTMMKSVKSSQQSVATSEADRGVVKQDGYRIPKMLNSPAAVAKVLNQQKGKMRTKDLREFLAQAAEDEFNATKQMKETLFEQAVREDVYQERQNQLRWQVHLGDTAMTVRARERVLAERELHWNIYRRRRGDPNMSEELQRTRAGMSLQRIHRGVLNEESCQRLETVAQFDVLQNDNWAARRTTLQRFRQGAWRMVYRIRAERRLKRLREVVKKLREGDDVEEELAGKSRSMKIYPVMNRCLLDVNRVTREPFPTAEPALDPSRLAERYHQKRLHEQLVQGQSHSSTGPEVSGDSAGAATDVASGGGSPMAPYYVPPTEMILRRYYQFQSLSVPQQYSLCGYERLDMEDTARSFVNIGLARPLRSGAEDEVVVIPLPSNEDNKALPASLMKTGGAPLSTNKPPQIDFLPPAALSESVQYPPLHIFNPSPGLQAFEQPKPYSEVDIDSALCPLPQYCRPGEGPYGPKTVGTQRRFLDHNETVAGLMGWRKFASPSLTALAQTPTLTNVWLPRWQDPFDDAILCDAIPPLLEELPKEDEANIVTVDTGTSSGEVSLPMNVTPEMVNKEFPVIGNFSQRWAELQGEVAPSKASTEESPRAAPLSPTQKQVVAGKIRSKNAARPKSPPPAVATGPVPRWTKEKELDETVTKEINRLGKKAEKSWQKLRSTMSNPDLLQ